MKPETTREIREDPYLGYDVWRSMHKRCKDPKTNGYSRYGGRGISVDPSWDSFIQFRSDMGKRPTPKHHLDRIDNEGNYSKENCRWVSVKENSRNKTTQLRKISWSGETLILSDWAERLGITVQSLRSRLSRWPLEKALTEPRGYQGPKRK